MPLPIVVADARAPGVPINHQMDPTTTNIFEFTPWEMGSWDDNFSGFAPLKYLGSNFTNGVVPDGQQCVAGFDNAGYIMGTSSSLFNGGLWKIDNATNVPGWIKPIVQALLNKLDTLNDDTADYSPNPFFGWNSETNANANTASELLTMVDGGEDGENLPMEPVIRTSRAIDTIFASDSSGDLSQWPDGDTLRRTLLRSKSDIGTSTAFPDIPDANTVQNLGLNDRPTMFGCYDSSPTPLVVWFANSPYSTLSNVSTFDLKFPNAQRDAMIQNGQDIVTQGSGKLDSEWPACVGCAMIQRSLQKTGTPLPDQCKSCFERYCWNGTSVDSAPGPYEPELKLGNLADTADATPQATVAEGTYQDSNAVVADGSQR